MVTVKFWCVAGGLDYTKTFRLESLPRIGEQVGIGATAWTVESVWHVLGKGLVDVSLADNEEIEAEWLIEDGWERA